jgi:hypothetical protein
VHYRSSSLTPRAGPATLHGKIHQWAAFGTFICMTIAALLQSLRLRFDPYWREQFIEATTIAASESSSSISVPFVVVLPIGAPCARTGTDAAVWR